MFDLFYFASQATASAATEAASEAASTSGGMNWMFISVIVMVAGLVVIGFFLALIVFKNVPLYASFRIGWVSEPVTR